MNTDRLHRLLTVADSHDQEELTVAHEAMIQALDAHKSGPTASTVANKNAIREDFEATLLRLDEKYFPGEQKAPEGERFAKRNQALKWLRAQGYKVSQGKFYQDCEAGFPELHRDGTVSRFQVMQYGQQLDVSARSIPSGGYAVEREDLEIRKLRADVEASELKTRKEDSRWMLKEDSWAAVAALLSTLQDGIRHHLHEGQGLLVHLAGGDPEREPEVYEAAVELVGRAFDELAGSRLDGIFETMQEDEGVQDEQ